MGNSPRQSGVAVKDQFQKSSFFQGPDLHFYDDCLEEDYLVTSSQTAFAINLLWEYTTLMIVNMCAFEGLAAYYNLYHNGGLEQANDEGRQELEARRFRG